MSFINTISVLGQATYVKGSPPTVQGFFTFIPWRRNQIASIYLMKALLKYEKDAQTSRARLFKENRFYREQSARPSCSANNEHVSSHMESSYSHNPNADELAKIVEDNRCTQSIVDKAQEIERLKVSQPS